MCCCGIWLAPLGRSRSATSGGRLMATTPATLSGWSTEVPYSATFDAGTGMWLAWLGCSGKSSDPIWSLVVSPLMFLVNLAACVGSQPVDAAGGRAAPLETYATRGNGIGATAGDNEKGETRAFKKGDLSEFPALQGAEDANTTRGKCVPLRPNPCLVAAQACQLGELDFHRRSRA